MAGPIFLSDYTEEEKRDIMEAMDKSKGPMVSLPSGCTVTNFFPGNLRDWFAGMALIGILGSRNGFLVDVGTDNAPGWAYDVADAMLKARDGK